MKTFDVIVLVTVMPAWLALTLGRLLALTDPLCIHGVAEPKIKSWHCWTLFGFLFAECWKVWG
jgi:hypothetical protein